MFKILIIFLFFVSGSFIANAQKLKLVSATRQQWSGGIAYRTGFKYHIQFSSKNDLTLDSLYLGQVGFRLINSNMADYGTIWFRNTHIYQVFIEQTNDIETHPIPVETSLQKPIEKKLRPKAPNYIGAALLVYKYKGKRKTLVIPSFRELPSLSYP